MESGAHCAIPGPREPVRVYAPSLSPETLAEIESVTREHRTLEDVTRWALTGRPLRIFPNARHTGESGVTVTTKAPGFDVIVQDEFTHDLTVPWDPASLFLVYDTT